MLLKTICVGQVQTNCYLLGDETGGVCAIVDPGDNAPAICKMIDSTGLTLTTLLLTHGHFDHITAIPALRKTYPNVEIYIHRDDAAEQGKPATYQLPLTPHTHFYDEGDRVALGSLTVEVLHTPGHTPGSVCLKVADVLFTGDTLFCGSMGRTDFEGGNEADIMRSLKKLAELPGDYRVCPGHEELSTLAAERRTNPYLQAALRR